MKSEEMEEHSMFRYTVIFSLLHLEEGACLKKAMNELAEKVWTLPDGNLRKYSMGTIECWYYRYRNGGLDALKTIPRKDNGSFRVLSTGVIEEIDALYKKHSRIKASTVIRLLRLQGTISGGKPSESTIYRYLRLRKKAVKDSLPSKELRSFEAPYSGSLIQVDIMYGPFLQDKGKDGKYRKRQTYLVAIIDDHSRLLCHGEFYFEQNLLAYLDCLKKAVQKRGCFERLYCDNGLVFLSSQVKRIAARMGSTVLHCKPRDCSAKGKIERFFKMVREEFLDECYATEFPKTLGELNRRFNRWYEEDYNTREHSGINDTPINKWMATSHRIKLLPPLKIDEIFTFEAGRRVRSDGTFSLAGKIFETHGALAGKKVLVNYDPFFPETAYVSHDNQDFGKANILDRQFNASKPRRNIN